MEKDSELLGSGKDGEREDNERKSSSSKRRTDEEEESTKKKPRLVWTRELHQQFVNAYNQLLIEYQYPTPKKILKIMNNPPGLTRHQLSNYLSNYRKILAESQQQPGNSSTNVAFGSNDHLQAALIPSSSAQENLQAVGGRIDRRFNNYGYENPNSWTNMLGGGVSMNIQNMDVGNQSGITVPFVIHFPWNQNFIGLATWNNHRFLFMNNNNSAGMPINSGHRDLVHNHGISSDQIIRGAGDIGSSSSGQNNYNNMLVIPLTPDVIRILLDHVRLQQQILSTLHHEVPPVQPFVFDVPQNFLELGSSSITGQNNSINNIPVSAPAVSVQENIPPNISQQQQQINSPSPPFDPLRTSNNTERKREPITLDLISALDKNPQEESRGPGGNDDGSDNHPD